MKSVLELFMAWVMCVPMYSHDVGDAWGFRYLLENVTLSFVTCIKKWSCLLTNLLKGTWSKGK